MPDFDVRVVQPKDLSAQDMAAWTALRAQNPLLYSPYFHVDYTRLVGELRPDAFVAIVSRGTKPIAFFPFQGPKSGKSGFARPIGAPMTDYHGFICASDTGFDPVNILKDADIGALHYWAMVNSGGDFSPFNQTCETACVMDISSGVEAWRTDRDSSYRRHLKSHRRRIRKTEEAYQSRRFEFASMNAVIFETLIRWKREKFAETGKYDVLSTGWTLQLLRHLWENQGELRCDMHVLYFDDRPAAIDLGLSDGVTFHSWMVGYDHEFHSLAPGIQLLEGLIDACADLGYQRIDLGAGLDGYKRHYATEDIQVGTGFIAVKGPAAALSQIYGAAEKLGEKALRDAPGKLRRRYSQIAACDDTFSGRAKAMIEAVKSSGPS